jgi:excisionase family DNA binding protein
LPALDGSSQKFLTIQEVCDRLNLSRTTIWRLMNQHGLKFVRIGGARRIREQDLEMWLERHTVSLNSDTTTAKRRDRAAR